MAVLSPYMPKWRSEAHFELKSDVWEMKRRDLAHTKPRTALLCMLLPRDNRRRKPASFKWRLGPPLVFLVLIPVLIKKLDVLHYIFSISEWI